MNWFLYSLSQYSNFQGRARRREYGWYTVFATLIILALVGIDYALGWMDAERGLGILSAIGAIVLMLPSLSLSVRRLHDHNATGWWVLICIIPLMSFFFTLFMIFAQGNEGENRFGPDPRRAPEPEPVVSE